MRRVILENGDTVFANNRKHRVGTVYNSIRRDLPYIITSVQQGEAVDEYGYVENTWFHTMRDATAEEVAEMELAKAQRAAMTPEQRINQTLDNLAGRFPNLDW